MTTILDELITGLNIISTIKSGQTLCRRNNKLIVIAHTAAEGIQRRWLGETRHVTRDIIKEYVNRGIEYALLLMESSYLTPASFNDNLYMEKYAERVNWLSVLKNALVKSIEGIKQTSTTYNHDETLTQEYITMIGVIEYQTSVVAYKLDTIIKK